MIDISLDEEQQLIQETVTSFAKNELRAAAREADESCAVPSASGRYWGWVGVPRLAWSRTSPAAADWRVEWVRARIVRA